MAKWICISGEITIYCYGFYTRVFDPLITNYQNGKKYKIKKLFKQAKWPLIDLKTVISL